jgi:transcriptional regulator with XRE-family HTH domain
MRWRLKEYLDEHGLTPFALVTASGLSTATVYPIARGKAERVSLETVQRIADTLQAMTGENVTLNDLFVLDTPPTAEPGAE